MKRKDEMTKKHNNVSSECVQPKKKKPKFLITFICIFVAIFLIFGVVLGVIMTVKESNAAVSFEGVTMDEEVTSFFISYNKMMYIQMLRASGVEDVSDNRFFWNRDAGNGKSYGELFEADTKKYISWVVVANYIYDSNLKLSDAEKERINKAVTGVLDYKAGGNESTFNKQAKKYGFTYDSFKTAATMLYKANSVFNINGVSLDDEMKQDYLSEYTHVKLLFIRTDSTFVVDEYGNRVTDAEGYKMHVYSETEKAAVLNDIEEIRHAISIIGNGVDGEMGELMFDSFLKKYKNDGDADMIGCGYYFHENEKFKHVFAEAYPEIMNEALEMSVGEYSEAAFENGVCFIYKCEPDLSDLSVSELEVCFNSFNSNLILKFFDKTITAIGKDVSFNEKYYDIDIFDIDYNTVFIPSF